jgi:hypothetical protein
MATSQMSEVIQHLRRTVLLRDVAGLTDGQLLENFISHRDGSALETLVQRHGPMVWGVCCRVLSKHHDAGQAVDFNPIAIGSGQSVFSPANGLGYVNGEAQDMRRR